MDDSTQVAEGVEVVMPVVAQEMSVALPELADDAELAGYILEKFQNPDVVVKRGKDGVVVSEVLPPPTLQGVCFELGITAAEFETRCEASESLRRAVELCYQREYDLLFRGGLSGELSSSFAGLAMKNRHKWSEKADTKVSGGLVVQIMAEGAGL